VEDETVAQMGCDFFVAGTHKWIFGPRGTGLIWAKAGVWKTMRQIFPFHKRIGRSRVADLRS
jgi:isopenicillin-N epimerase